MSSQFRIYFYPIFKYSFFYTGPMLKAVFITEMVILLKYIIIIIIIIIIMQETSVKFVYSRQQKMKFFLTSRTIMANYEWKS